jgi:ectoine hydroxylase-related dioxygenase (phytanoyl-CoA dioxygenase family)
MMAMLEAKRSIMNLPLYRAARTADGAPAADAAPMRVTNQHVRFFRDTGYLRLNGVLPEADVSEMRRIITSHVANRVQPYRTDPNGEIVKLDALVSRDPIFLRVIRAPLIADALRSLLGPNVELKLNRHNHATLNAPGYNKYRLHRDVLQWTRNLVTVLIYLEDATVENGCTYVVPATQHLPCRNVPDNGVTCMDDNDLYADLLEQSVPVPMPAGGVLLLDACVFHSVGENTSGSTRQSLCLAFHSADELSEPSDQSQLVLGERIYVGNDLMPASSYTK